MVKILAIGNSFSQDATAHLHDMAACGRIETKVVNLYIGGCSLATHWENVCQDNSLYEYELNGINTGRMVTVKEALCSDEWDFVTMQQASHDSGIIESYYPYIDHLSEYVKQHAPKATRLIHQTWAYDVDSTHEAFVRYACDQANMYRALCAAYRQVSTALGLSLIPCGDVIQALRYKEGMAVCRDGFHMHLIYGRFATAATWYESILNGNILLNEYTPPAAEVADCEQLAVIRKIVHDVVGRA